MEEKWKAKEIREAKIGLKMYMGKRSRSVRSK